MSLSHWLKPLAVIAAVATVTAIGPPAGAADSYKLLPSGSGKKACPLGYVCLWEGSEFTGRGVAFFNTELWYEKLPTTYRFIQNKARSAFSNGRNNDVRFGRYGSLDGGTFALCKGEAMAYLDIARSDGAIPGKGWQKEISSHQFTDIAHCAG